jgi:hypothetical protein
MSEEEIDRELRAMGPAQIYARGMCGVIVHLRQREPGAKGLAREQIAKMIEAENCPSEVMQRVLAVIAESLDPEFTHNFLREILEECECGQPGCWGNHKKRGKGKPSVN